MTSKSAEPDWASHLQIVFTVLIGVAFAQAFTILGEAHFNLAQLLLIATVFYVVFDCWFALNRDLMHLAATKGPDITLYLVTLVSYSCLPFLYFAHTASTPSFEAPEFLTANLAAICILDAIRRTLVFRRNGNSAAPDEKRWHSKNRYLILTGYGYGGLLVLGTLAFTGWDASATLKAGLIFAFWVIFRIVDYVYIDILSDDSDAAPSP
jgi:uncharacterized membrane protein